MPTGYTHAVKDSKITTLREFALTCARGMGALITMRDDAMDAPIPEKFEPDTRFYDEQIASAQKELSRLPHLTAAQCDLEAEEEFKAKMKRHTERLAEKYQHKLRYSNMLSKVEAWRCDDEVRTLKDFMIEQLQKSIEFDCDDRYDREHIPVRMTGEDWRKQRLERASRDLAYGTKHREEELQRVEGRNRWLAALRKSLAE